MKYFEKIAKWRGRKKSLPESKQIELPPLPEEAKRFILKQNKDAEVVRNRLISGKMSESELALLNKGIHKAWKQYKAADDLIYKYKIDDKFWADLPVD